MKIGTTRRRILYLDLAIRWARDSVRSNEGFRIWEECLANLSRLHERQYAVSAEDEDVELSKTRYNFGKISLLSKIPPRRTPPTSLRLAGHTSILSK